MGVLQKLCKKGNYSLLYKLSFSLLTISLIAMVHQMEVIVLLSRRVMADMGDKNQSWSPPRPPKRILLWTGYWRSDELFRKFFVDMLHGQCAASDCVMVHNHSELSRADAVVFNLNNLDLKPSKLPIRHRPPGQIWVLFSIESPAHDRVEAVNLAALNGLFNWTMTYRLDSDLPMIYGLVLQRLPKKGTVPLISLPETVRQALQKWPPFQRSRRPTVKKRLVSWMVSKCKTPGGREEYVRQLQQHVQVRVPNLAPQIEPPIAKAKIAA